MQCIAHHSTHCSCRALPKAADSPLRDNYGFLLCSPKSECTPGFRGEAAGELQRGTEGGQSLLAAAEGIGEERHEQRPSACNWGGAAYEGFTVMMCKIMEVPHVSRMAPAWHAHVPGASP